MEDGARRGRTVQFPNHTRLSILQQLLPERPFLRALPQPQQSNEDVLPRVFVREERLPASVSNVVSTNEFEFVGLCIVGRDGKSIRQSRNKMKERSNETHPNAVVNLVKTDFAAADVSTCQAEVTHAGESEFTQVAVLDAGRDERHGDVAAKSRSARLPR
jgi:hypothetical protein